MNKQQVFPLHSMAEGLSESSIQLEGKKVLFDKKVSLLPADITKVKKIETNRENGG